MKKVGVIGGGIIGLSCAYYLNKSGHKVTIIDKGSFDEGCSFRNAGMIVPSHFIPLAAPGMISKGVRWMFNSTSPFYIKPRLNTDLIKWGYLFYKSATKEKVAKAIPALKELSLLSKSLYQIWSRELPFDFGYEERGLMMLYQTLEMEREEAETAHLANHHKIEARILNPEEIQQLEPDVRVNARGAVYYPGDAHLIPQVLVFGLIDYLNNQGVTFKGSTEVQKFNKSGKVIESIATTSGKYEFDQIVLASGSWSGAISKQLNLNLPMQAGKGYSFTIEGLTKTTRIPSIFLEARVAVTPMGSSIRFGGTMEIAGVNHEINMNRVKGIVDAIPNYYPDMKVPLPKKEEVWHGLRPCSPDGLPYIGKVDSIDNLTVATGHAMMGLSLGPATGKLVAELINNEPTSMNLRAFAPMRFQ